MCNDDQMNTFDLVRSLRGNDVTEKKFRGVFPCNHLPEKILKPAFIVANTDPSNKPGTHWVAFYFPKKGPAEYFDSFGRRPYNKHFLRFLQRNSTSFISNTKQLQGDQSVTCGHYCCVYIYQRCKGKPMKEFLRRFSKNNFDINDNKIVNMYSRYYADNNNNNDGDDVKRTRSRSPQFGGLFVCNQTCQPRKKSVYSE